MSWIFRCLNIMNRIIFCFFAVVVEINVVGGSEVNGCIDVIWIGD